MSFKSQVTAEEKNQGKTQVLQTRAILAPPSLGPFSRTFSSATAEMWSYIYLLYT